MIPSSSSSSLRKRVAQQCNSVQLPEMADIIGQALDSNPFRGKGGTRQAMWEEQCLINFPILYWGSILLHQFGKERGCSTFLFATRDGCHWYRIFKALFPDTTVHYFECSRIMLENGAENAAYNSYVHQLFGSGGAESISGAIGKSVYVDIHGTGGRMFTYFRRVWKAVPFCFLLTAHENGIEEMPAPSRHWSKKAKKVKVVHWQCHGAPIESLNYDIIGTLQTFNVDGPVRDALEYPFSRVKPYHDAMANLIAQVKPFDTLEIANKVTEKRHWYERLEKVTHTGCDAVQWQKPAVLKYISHISRHPQTTKSRRPHKKIKL